MYFVSRTAGSFANTAIFLGAIILLIVSPVRADASSLVWGEQDGTPSKIQIVEDGIYAVPLNTPAPASVDSPFAWRDFTGTLYRIDDSGATPVREEIATINCLGCDPVTTLSWPSAGQYELDLPLFEPPVVGFHDAVRRLLAGILLADIADAQAEEIETIHFIIEEAGPTTFTPVIIVPGILGSARHNDVWLIDPITHGYDNLIDTLAANGYEKDVTLFPFPYDWHLSNRTTATLLKIKIDEVKGICGCDEVDIVAHSMGGLAARQYIQSIDYAGDVRKLIFLGTPQMGAPSAYLMWEGGKSDRDFKSRVVQSILTTEALKHGYSNLFDYVRNTPIPSVQELLPVYGYIKHVGSPDIPSFPNSEWYPNNLFLSDLNGDITDLYTSGVTISNFVGQTADDKTITTIRVVPPSIPNSTALWGYGIPEDFGNSSTDEGLERGAGDGTVPLSSAGLVISDLQILDSEHNELPSKTEGLVFKKLTGNDATTLVNNSHGLFEAAKNVLIFQILSPADIVVEDPDHLKVGKDFDSGDELHEIPDAFYSGYETDEEYVTIPNPKDGEYKVFTQGTGSGGAYTIAIGVINDATSSETFFTGTTLPNLITEHDINVDPAHPDETTIIPADQTSPTITFVQPTATTYTHDAMLPIKVTFTDDTGVASSSVSFDATAVAASSTVDLFFQTLGNHMITAYAKDFVNNAITSSRTVQVIATTASTRSDVARAFALRWIHKDTKNDFINKLDKVAKIEKKIATIVVSAKPKAEKDVERLEKKIDNILRELLEDLEKDHDKGKVNDRAYQLLGADINWLIDH